MSKEVELKAGCKRTQVYDSYDAVFDELDAEISETEILTCIRNLNRNKSCSEDDILNELFLDCKDVMI